MESFAHHFHITRRVVDSANDVSRSSFSWSFLVSLKLIARDRSKHRLASGSSSSHGNAGDCSDRRTPRSAVQDHRVESSSPAISGSSGFGASVRFCPAFADDMARHERGSSRCQPSSPRVRLRCNSIHCRTAISVSEQYWPGRNLMYAVSAYGTDLVLF